MKKWPVILIGVVDAILILISLSSLLTLYAFTTMAFDAPGSQYHWQTWLLFLGVNGLSIVFLLIAIWGAVKMLQKRKLFLSLIFAGLPLIVLAILFTILNLN